MDNKVNFYEMPWMQLNSYPQKWNPEREAKSGVTEYKYEFKILELL